MKIKNQKATRQIKEPKNKIIAIKNKTKKIEEMELTCTALENGKWYNHQIRSILSSKSYTPPSCCPWPRAWGGSSRSQPLASGVRWLLLAAPDLQRRIAPPGRHP